MMENSSERYSLASTISYSRFLSIPYVSPVDKISSLHYPVQPHCLCRYHANLPSDRYKNIVDYYYQDYQYDSEERFILPEEGQTALVFRCHPQKYGAFLVGTPTSRRKVEYLLPGCDYFIVFFYFGMNYAFYPIYGTELTDKYFPLDEITSGGSQSITERIVLATTFQERIHIFEQYIEERMPTLTEIPARLPFIIATIRNNAGVKTNEELTCNCLYTDRHIRRLFQKYVGIPPRLFSNIIRHYKTVRKLTIKPYLDMSGLAMEFGYYDQSHFIKEFRRFQGSTPSQYINHLSNRKIKS
jgi:AraC-like DNA-binding protein